MSQQTTPKTKELLKAKKELDRARERGDQLLIELAESALNDLIDRLPRGSMDVTLVTGN